MTQSTTPAISEFDYGYELPDDFLHKIWIKADANATFECKHQFVGSSVFANEEPIVMEYVALDDDSTNPANWSANFTEAVAAYLALLVCPELLVETRAKGGVKINANEVRNKLEGVFRDKLSDAKMRDAIQQQSRPLAPGRWVTSRNGSSYRTGSSYR